VSQENSHTNDYNFSKIAAGSDEVGLRTKASDEEKSEIGRAPSGWLGWVQNTIQRKDRHYHPGGGRPFRHATLCYDRWYSTSQYWEVV